MEIRLTIAQMSKGSKRACPVGEVLAAPLESADLSPLGQPFGEPWLSDAAPNPRKRLNAKRKSHQLTPVRTAEERERLILEHLPQVRLIARRIHERLPDTVILEDVISMGIIGLITAVDHFEASHNVKLKTYAEYRIRSAILDSLRGLDWAPRQKRKMAKQIQSAIAAARQHLHRE